MIDKTTFKIDWIEQISKQNRNTDKILIEKVIRAISLLYELKSSGLEFIFKGGTALMLMLNKPLCLSIDIDIIVAPEDTELKVVLEAIIQNSKFIRYEEQKRMVQSGIEKAHYKFYYMPLIKTHSEEEYILLDVLFEANPYNKLIQTPIQSPFIKLVDKPNTVKTPLCICSRGQAGDCWFADIQQGIKRISGFIYSKRYIIEDAIISAAKAAYLASLIKKGDKMILRFSSPASCNELLITVTELNKMNKLKKALLEAFWYWYQTSLIYIN